MESRSVGPHHTAAELARIAVAADLARAQDEHKQRVIVRHVAAIRTVYDPEVLIGGPMRRVLREHKRNQRLAGYRAKEREKIAKAKSSCE